MHAAQHSAAQHSHGVAGAARNKYQCLWSRSRVAWHTQKKYLFFFDTARNNSARQHRAKGSQGKGLIRGHQRRCQVVVVADISVPRLLAPVIDFAPHTGPDIVFFHSGLAPEEEKLRLKALGSGNEPADWWRLAKWLEGSSLTERRMEAVRWLIKAGEAGHVMAQGRLKALYSEHGKLANPTECTRWSLLAATNPKAKGNALAEYAYRLELGLGCTKNEELAAEWNNKALALDSQMAATNLGIEPTTEGDYVEAARLYQRARSWPSAQWSLSQLYEEGKGVEKDEKVARTLLHKAARGGIGEAMERLLECYTVGGLGIKPQGKKRAPLARRLATAFFDTGWRYRLSQPARSRLEWATAIEKGSIVGANNLAVLFLRGDGGPANLEEGLRLLPSVADVPKPHRAACWNLSVMYTRDVFGVERDEKEATKWCQLALQAKSIPVKSLFRALVLR